MGYMSKEGYENLVVGTPTFGVNRASESIGGYRRGS